MSIENPSTDVLAPLAYSVSEACKVSSIGRTYLYQLINEGRLEVRKCGPACKRDPVSGVIGV